MRRCHDVDNKHACGSEIRHESRGEALRVDTGCRVGLTPGIDDDSERAGGLKSMVCGGEGLFPATLRGKGEGPVLGSVGRRLD